MTKQQSIQADTTSAVILQIPLEMLAISDLNPRATVSEAHIETLADSIQRFGLIHNLAGLMDADGRVGIVAGGCRLRAIQMIAKRSETNGWPSQVCPNRCWTHWQGARSVSALPRPSPSPMMKR